MGILFLDAISRIQARQSHRCQFGIQGRSDAVREWEACRHLAPPSPLSRRARGLTSLQRETFPAPHPARAFLPLPKLRHTAGGPDRRR